jgi:hypothetical protein
MPTTYAIPNGATQFAATTYTSSGTTQTITNGASTSGTSFQPDLVWQKIRSVVGDHYLIDSVRTAANVLSSNNTNAEGNTPTFLTSFNSNGWTQGTGNYTAGATIVGWQWKASNAVAVSNTAGSITSQVSVNPISGFSIGTFSFPASPPQTIGHGLGVAPSMIIVKSRSNGTQGWIVYHISSGNTGYIALNQNAAFTSTATAWNNTSPTSSVFTIGTGFSTANFGANGVFYAFSEIAGFSKFGSYTGNGSTDGPFVYLGFRPRWVMLKRIDSTGDWFILDTSRDTYNVAGNVLYPNLSNAESGVVWFNDILSNGFKLRVTGANQNASGGTYIYAAFAENPFKYANAR